MSLKTQNISTSKGQQENEYLADNCCAEICITEKSQIIYRCALCISEYTTLPHLMDHLIQYHCGKENEDQSIDDASFGMMEDELLYVLDEDDAVEGVCIRMTISPLPYAKVEFHCVCCNYRNYNYSNVMAHIYTEHYTSANYDGEQNIRKAIGLKALEEMCVGSSKMKLPQYILIKATEDEVINRVKGNKQAKKEKSSRPGGRGKHYSADLVEETDFRIDANDKFYVCNKCDRRFLNERKVREHLISHRTERRYKCSQCPSAFKDQKNFLVHLRRHGREPKCECSHCHHKFHTPSELEQHERRHTGERIFMCTQCGQKFFTSSLLSAHQRRHNDNRPYECEKCKKKFFDGHKLKQHQAAHDNKRAFKCNQCDSSFNFRKTLATHMKLHLNLKEYVCSICKKAFNQKPGLLSHMKIHTKSNATEMLDSEEVATQEEWEFQELEVD